MNRFYINPTEKFKIKLKKLILKNKLLIKKIDKVLKLLGTDPFYSSLKTHKVKDKNSKVVFSSWVTGDLRITWDFQKGAVNILDVLDIGGHSGKNKVY